MKRVVRIGYCRQAVAGLLARRGETWWSEDGVGREGDDNVGGDLDDAAGGKPEGRTVLRYTVSESFVSRISEVVAGLVGRDTYAKGLGDGWVAIQQRRPPLLGVHALRMFYTGPAATTGFE